MKLYLIALCALMVTMLYIASTQIHLNHDRWTCTDYRVLHEVDANGVTKEIKTCVEYRRNE